MPLSIRRAGPADVPIVAEFNRRLAQETEGKSLDPVILTRGVAAAIADANKAIYFVATRDEIVVGQLAITREWSDWRNGWFWWIQSVYVQADARRQGVFSQLYHHLHQEAVAATDVIGIRLYVEQENRAAQETYRKLGMDRAGYFILQRFPL